MAARFPSVELPTPLRRTLSMPCEVQEFLDGSEQRWASGDPLNAFEVSFSDVLWADVAAVANFFATVKGAFDATWTFTGPDGVDYTNMGFDQDELAAVESGNPERFSFSVKLRQTAKSGDYSAAAARVYPTLPNGCYTQRPYTATQRWLTTRNDLESGARYSWAEWAKVKGFWTCEYPVLTLAEMQGRIDFFVAMGGRLKAFSFHDPNGGGTDHAKCRFDQDSIEIRCVGAGQWATSLKIAEFF